MMNLENGLEDASNVDKNISIIKIFNYFDLIVHLFINNS